METAVLGEIYRTLTHRGEHPATHPRMARGIRSFQRDLGDRCGPGFVIHAGEGRLPLAGGVTAAGFTSL